MLVEFSLLSISAFGYIFDGMKKDPMEARLDFLGVDAIEPIGDVPGVKIRQALAQHGYLTQDIVVIVSKERYDELVRRDAEFLEALERLKVNNEPDQA